VSTQESVVSIFEKNVSSVREAATVAALRCGRSVSSIEIIAVTKFHPVEHILPLKTMGIISIGESRVQELQEKFEELGDVFKIHFIGHLQTNKAKQAVAMADLIHSIDSERLAIAVNNAAAALQKKQDILLQVNCSNEDQKGGVAPSEFEAVLKRVAQFANLRIVGLMTMAALTDDATAVRKAFHLLHELREKGRSMNLPGVDLVHLSMGMSNDFEIAIEEGATMIRVGSALFEGLSE
jgi:pyridoxal phosphate enzyme (YggS family)